MFEYWNNRKTKLQLDLDHVKRNMKTVKDREEKEHLMEVYAQVYDELEVAKEACLKFAH